jgi:hypothetical protein
MGAVPQLVEPKRRPPSRVIETAILPGDRGW